MIEDNWLDDLISEFADDKLFKFLYLKMEIEEWFAIYQDQLSKL